MNAVHRVVPEVGKSRLLLRKRTLLKQRIIDGSHTTSRSPVFGELLWRVGGIGAADQCHRTTGHRARRDQRTRHRHARQEPAERSRVSWPPVTSRSLRAPHGASRAGGGAHHASTPDTLSTLVSESETTGTAMHSIARIPILARPYISIKSHYYTLYCSVTVGRTHDTNKASRPFPLRNGR